MFSVRFWLNQNPKNKSSNIIHRKSVKLSLAGLLLVGIGSYAQASECDKPDGERPPVPELTVNTHFGDESKHVLLRSGIWAVWWGKNNTKIAEETAAAIVEVLDDVRCRALIDLNLQDPPEVISGHYFNVFLHIKNEHNDGKDDGFTDDWAVGVGRAFEEKVEGTSGVGTIRHKTTNVYDNDAYTMHEGFHIFQLSRERFGDDQPFKNEGDSAWFIEATANWFTIATLKAKGLDFVVPIYSEVAGVEVTPYVALWHSGGSQVMANSEAGVAGDPDARCHWFYGVHQYGMDSLLVYMTDVHNIDPSIITTGFSDDPPTKLTPQEYMVNKIGYEKFSRIVGDWAAANADDFSYVPATLVDAGRAYYSHFESKIEQGDPGLDEEDVFDDDGKLMPKGICYPFSKPQPELMRNVRRYAVSHDSGSIPVSAQAPYATAPRAFGYNVIQVENVIPGSYTVTLNGEEKGLERDADGKEIVGAVSERADTVFKPHVLVKYANKKSTITPLTMSNSYTGELEVEVNAGAEGLYLVVAATPNIYKGQQSFGYSYSIKPKELVWNKELSNLKVGAILKHKNSRTNAIEYFRLAKVPANGDIGAPPAGQQDNQHWEYLGENWNEFDQQVLAWGHNDRKGTKGDVYIYANPYSKKVEFYKLKNLGSDQRYWYFPTGKDGVRDNYYWTYLGNDYPNQ